MKSPPNLVKIVMEIVMTRYLPIKDNDNEIFFNVSNGNGNELLF